MDICWDSLEGIKLTKNGVFLKNDRDSYIYMEACKRCGKSYLTLKHIISDYCGRSCAYSGRKYSEEIRKNMGKAKRGKKSHFWKGGAHKKGLPLFETYGHRLWCDVVGYKYIDGLKILTVKCSSCEDMFVPTVSNVVHRVRYLEGKESCESRFYCSDGCRMTCPVFNQTKYPKGFKLPFEYTIEEYNAWRSEVMSRVNYRCEYCGSRATDAHHIRPKALESFFALDPDYGLACCEECHYKYGHSDECSTASIANTICL